MIIYAHRGMHGPDAPQNTMAAFGRAAEAGFGIETDLRDTSDGRVVLFHDRCAAGRPVDTMTHAELEAAVRREVPLLDDIDALLDRVPVNLDVKTPRALALAAPFISANAGRIALVSAFRHDLALAAAAIGANAGYLMASRTDATSPLPAALPGLEACVWDYDMVDEALVRRCRDAGLSTICYGALTRVELRRLVNLAVDAAITDRPELHGD